MKNIVMGLLAIGILGTAAWIWYDKNQEPVPPMNPRPGHQVVAPPPAVPNPLPQVQLPLEDFIPQLPVRAYPQAIEITEEELPKLIDRIVLALVLMDNDDRRTTGERLAALPASAVPIMKKALEREGLSWVAVASLVKGIELIERREAGKAMPDVLAADLHWSRQNIVEAYKRVGNRNAQWDKQVIEAFELWSLLVCDAPTSHDGMQLRIQQLLTKALRDGCDDPLAHYCLMTHYSLLSTIPPKDLSRDEHKGFITSAKMLENSKYPPMRKAWCLTRAAWEMHLEENRKDNTPAKQTPPKPNVLEMYEKGFANFVEELDTGILPQSEAYDFVTYCLNAAGAMGGMREQIFNRIKPMLEKHYADTGLTEAIEGDFLISWGWDARGTGFADTVTAQGWRLFHERIAKAKVLLTNAMAKYPMQTKIPARLMTALFAGEHEAEDIARCLDAYARNRIGDDNPLGSVLNFLQPKWGGSFDEMIQFGRRALLTGNWEDRVPQVLVDAHFLIARTMAPSRNDDLLNHPDYFKNPEVWMDIELVCENLLKWHPGDRSVMSQYLIAACGAEKWEIAHRLFEALGPDADYRHFMGNSTYGAMKAKVQGLMIKPELVTAEMIATEDKMRELMVSMNWHLDYFSPGAKARRRIKWDFNANGTLTDRMQPNWKIEEGLLVTYPTDRRVYNKWKFNLAKSRWESVNNNPDEEADQNAYIIPVTKR